MKKTIAILTTATLLVLGSVALRAHEGHDHEAEGKEHLEQGKTVTITGEVLDMACYIDHNATGEKHASCAATCIESGLPVGIKNKDDGKVYLLIGEHKPINKELIQYAGKTITVKGKAVSRDGFNMIENTEIMK